MIVSINPENNVKILPKFMSRKSIKFSHIYCKLHNMVLLVSLFSSNC